MITSVSGPVLDTGTGHATFSVGGIGLRVDVPAGARAPRLPVGKDATLHTAFVVREDSMTLYGFETIEELQTFNILITVNGVGPRSALGILSFLTPAQIALAVTNEDEKEFRKVSGIGPKTAKLILISLAGKLDFIVTEPSESENNAGSLARAQVVSGLTMLGWKEDTVQEIVSSVEAENPDLGSEDLMRKALAALKKVGR